MHHQVHWYQGVGVNRRRFPSSGWKDLGVNYVIQLGVFRGMHLRHLCWKHIFADIESVLLALLFILLYLISG